MINRIFIFFAIVLLAGCRGESGPPPEEVLNDWHLAASQANEEKYFSYFYSDSSIFMGTDQTERWTAIEFRKWSSPFFERGSAWDFKPYARSLRYNPEKTVCWFEEEIDTDHLGPLRGTGVLLKSDNVWKIDQYILSIAVPNQLVNNLVTQIDSLKTLSDEN